VIARNLSALLLALCAFAASPKPITAENYRVYRGDGSPASLDDALARSRSVDVTFIGESHDDPVAHYLEAEILKQVAGPGWALSLEMFERDVQGVVDEYLQGLIDERGLIASGRAWSNYRTDYKPLLDIAKEKHIPVIAANAPKRYVDIVSRKGQDGLLALSPEAKKTLPPLPYAPGSQAYRERFQREMAEEMAKVKMPHNPGSGSHGDHQSDLALQSQSLWDAAMAYSIAEFLKAHPGEHIVQVNGSFHSEYRQGILEHLERYRPGTTASVIIILRDKSFPAWKPEMKDKGDFVIVTDPRVKPPESKKR